MIVGSVAAFIALSVASVIGDTLNTELYTGDAGVKVITGTLTTGAVDFVLAKKRNGATSSQIFNSIDGVGNRMATDDGTVTETFNADTLTAFGSSAVTLGADATTLGINANTDTFTMLMLSLPLDQTNTTGTITTTIKKNTYAALAQFTGTGANATLGHGLDSAPEVGIFFNTAVSGNHNVYSSTVGNTKKMALNLTDTQDTAGASITFWNNTSPTSSVFSIGTNADINGSGNKINALFLRSEAGKCKIGTYTGNGASNPQTGVGFQARVLLIKAISITSHYNLMDENRVQNSYNDIVSLDIPGAELVTSTNYRITIDADGFTPSDANGDDYSMNRSGHTYIYIAFA